MFEKAKFIKTSERFECEFNKEKSPCFIFRKKFKVEKPFNSKIYVCGLGYAYYYLNGEKVSEDLFTAPVSDYNKTLWVNTYCLDHLLKKGENVLTVICGNGFYNEAFKTVWGNQDASYRDNPKFILSLENNGEEILKSDETWKCSRYTPILYNYLRSGEHFDSRLFDNNIFALEYNDENWNTAIVDNNTPKGIFRECNCPPIRECDEYKAVNMIKIGDNKYLFDIGQNISGYIRLKIKQSKGDLLIIRYAESLKDDNSLDLNNATVHYYDNSEYMTDKFICNGEEFVWSPMFTYHGFRYIEIEGIKNPSLDMVSGIFVHQDVKQLSGFECSNEELNKLYKMGQMATLSNLFYMPTDCPTREKFGWMNDAQASLEQMLINFDVVDLFKKWNTDILDAMRDDGSLPGIVPSHGWGYDWGNGPVSDGSLFEVPYKIYLYTGDNSLLIKNLPYFDKYINYLNSRLEDDGMIHFGLNDWMGPEISKVPVEFLNTVFVLKFLRIAKLAANIKGDESLFNKYSKSYEETRKLFKDRYIDISGNCNINEQTSVSMIIYYGLYDDLDPLKKQLKKLVEERDFHHNCGMVGLRRLFIALNKCGLEEYAYKILTSRGFPSFFSWMEAGGTTLWEKWHMDESKNHHMYSDFMSWIIKTLVGINLFDSETGYKKVNINPVFINDLDYCSGYTETVYGKITVSWRRENNKVILEVNVPEDITAFCEYAENGVLNTGNNILEVLV